MTATDPDVTMMTLAQFRFDVRQKTLATLRAECRTLIDQAVMGKASVLRLGVVPRGASPELTLQMLNEAQSRGGIPVLMWRPAMSTQAEGWWLFPADDDGPAVFFGDVDVADAVEAFSDVMYEQERQRWFDGLGMETR